jgi:hypothetical protein
MALGSTHPLTEMSTKNLPEGIKGGRPARKADNLTAICPENVGASTSHKPMGPHALLQGQLYLVFCRLFNDAVSNSGHMVLDSKVINE